jgi:hypothetical protein
MWHNLNLIVTLLAAVLASPVLFELAYLPIFYYQRKRKYSRWIALFLSNGQVYFGRMAKINRTDIRLETIFYLEDKSDYDPNTQGPAQDRHLIKLGEELHGPEDFMLVNRQHILFLENLRANGQVARAIEKYRSEHPLS